MTRILVYPVRASQGISRMASMNRADKSDGSPTGVSPLPTGSKLILSCDLVAFAIFSMVRVEDLL
jgi:hypothetical protein